METWTNILQYRVIYLLNSLMTSTITHDYFISYQSW